MASSAEASEQHPIAAPVFGEARKEHGTLSRAGLAMMSAERRNIRMAGRPALLALTLILSGCLGSSPSTPSLSATMGSSTSAASATQSASVAPPHRGLDQVQTGGTAFHDIMSRPYNPTTQQMQASIAVEDDVKLNPDGSFRLPPAIHIPIIDISSGHSALAGGETYATSESVDINVPW